MLLLPLLLALAQDAPVFRSDTALVHLDAEVREDRHSVAGLTREDFQVTDRGKRQAIVYFGHEEEPLDVVLLLDGRHELRPDLKRVAEAAHVTLSELRERDRVAVAAFGTGEHCRNETIAGFTSDFLTVERSIAGTVLNGEQGSQGCSILSGFSAAAGLLHELPRENRRRAIVVITDDKGAPVRSETVRNTVQDLWTADAVLLGVVIHSGQVVITIGPPYRGVRYAADKTGGDVLKTEDAAEGLREMLHRLRSRYSLYYALPGPNAPGEERKVQVQLSVTASKLHPRAVVRARTAYIAP